LSRRREDPNLSEDGLWAAKQKYDSAFHPQTGEKVFLPGRMSFQVFGNMSITGCMLIFYKSAPAVIFWQFANQSFNAIVNYSNRNASVGVSNEQLGKAYVAATSASVFTALALNKAVASSPVLSAGIIGRFVPLVAVAAANCINIPLMRQREVNEGIGISLEDGTEVGSSTAAAKEALMQVIPSRVAMAVPALFFPPLIMAKLERTSSFIRNPWLKAPATLLLTGICLTFSTPLCCALFPQKAAISVSNVEEGLRERLMQQHPNVSQFYYNKGL
jgi:tricarboxylate carrier